MPDPADRPPLEILGKGRFLELVSREGWEYVRRPHGVGVVMVVAMTEARELVMTVQWRPAVARRVLSLPAGLTGDEDGSEGEEAAEAARRELLEECGYHAAELRQLATGSISPGLSAEILHWYLARGLTRRHDGGGVGDEDIETLLLPLDAPEPWLREREAEGLLVDSKVWAALYFAQRELRHA